MIKRIVKFAKESNVNVSIVKFEETFPGKLKFIREITSQDEFCKNFVVLLNKSIGANDKFIEQKDNQDKNKKDVIYFSVSLNKKNVTKQNLPTQLMNKDDSYYLMVKEKSNLYGLNSSNEFIRKKNISKALENLFSDLSEILVKLDTNQIINIVEIIKKYGCDYFCLKPHNFEITYRNKWINEFYSSILKKKTSLLQDKKENIQEFNNNIGLIYNFNNLKTSTKKLINKLRLFFKLEVFCIIVSKEILVPILKTLSKEKNNKKQIDIFHLLSLIIKLVFNKKVNDDYFKDLFNKINYYIKIRICFELIKKNSFRSEYFKNMDKILEQYEYDEEEQKEKKLWNNSFIVNNKNIDNNIQKFKVPKICRKYKRGVRKTINENKE